jgi:pyruvate dehydrogenase complex dehydrogenase (E1) component
MCSIKIYTYGNVIEINQATEELCNRLIEWFGGTGWNVIKLNHQNKSYSINRQHVASIIVEKEE